jgi:osmotically inducible protein OsmC
MSDVLQQRLYVAEATVRGGRGGHGRTSDGMLDVDIRPPVELGGAGGGTNPEQLFAVGYGACFQSAMSLAGKELSVDTSHSTLTTRVALGPVDGGRYALAVELEVSIPGVEREVAEKILKRAHEVCPYSNATRGNIEVTLKVA